MNVVLTYVPLLRFFYVLRNADAVFHQQKEKSKFRYTEKLFLFRTSCWSLIYDGQMSYFCEASSPLWSAMVYSCIVLWFRVGYVRNREYPTPELPGALILTSTLLKSSASEEVELAPLASTTVFGHPLACDVICHRNILNSYMLTIISDKPFLQTSRFTFNVTVTNGDEVTKRKEMM